MASSPVFRLASPYIMTKASGEAAGARLALGGPAAGIRYRALSESVDLDAELAFLATPAEVSADLAPKLLARGARETPLLVATDERQVLRMELTLPAGAAPLRRQTWRAMT